jgi:hypothetical protein
MNDFIQGLLLVIGVLVLTVLIMGFPLMLLWNWLMPELFGLPMIGFWQAVGLNLLASILFKTTVNTNKD